MTTSVLCSTVYKCNITKLSLTCNSKLLCPCCLRYILYNHINISTDQKKTKVKVFSFWCTNYTSFMYCVDHSHVSQNDDMEVQIFSVLSPNGALYHTMEPIFKTLWSMYSTAQRQCKHWTFAVWKWLSLLKLLYYYYYYQSVNCIRSPKTLW